MSLADVIRARLAETAPNGCTWCGVEQREHYTRWAMSIGLHQWVEPENWQRLDRMRARRRHRLAAQEPTP